MTFALPDSPADVLEFARQRQVAADREEAAKLAAAAHWAAMHSETSVVPELEQWESMMPIAGEDTPEVPEFCIAEFAAVIGLSTAAGREYVGDAVELAHRLPQLWARVMEGSLPAWRARRVAQATKALCPEGAGFVDDQVAAFAHRISLAQLERTIEEAIRRFDPELLAERAAARDDGRKVDIYADQVSFDGMVDVNATLDATDAADLEQAVSRRARHLGDLGSEAPLDARRAMALGEIARNDLTLDLETGERIGGSVGRELRIHLNADDLAGAAPGVVPMARVEKSRALVDLDAVRRWLQRPDVAISVRAVIDTRASIAVDSWEIPDRLREQVIERDKTCRFPHCNRLARLGDIDHIQPYDDTGPPGQTSTENLAGLCRTHHRHKTFTNWSYTQIEPGIFLWRSPHGHRFLVTPSGTQLL